MRLLLALTIATLLAGCASPAAEKLGTTSTGGPQALPFPDVFVDNDHGDATAHSNSYHFELTDHQPLAGSATHGSLAHALDRKAGWLFAAVYGGEADAEGGFFVFNVSDPQHPLPVGRYRFPGALGGDRSMEATDDADYVVLGTEIVDCAGHVAPAGPGLWLIDVRDKANPLFVDYMPSPLGWHSVTIHHIKGEDYVFGLNSGGDKDVVHIDRSGPLARLVAISDVGIGHDSVVVDDPVLHKPLLYASNGGGFEIWDVSEPATPQKLAAWNIPDRKPGKYYIHTSAVQTIQGHRIVVVTSEDWTDYPSSLWVLDASDLRYIETVSNWSAPGAKAADGLRYSMHNPRFDGDKLLLAYYHAGVWAMDMSTPAEWAHPVVVAQYMPNLTNGWKPQPAETHAFADRTCGAFHLTDAPLVFDVEEGDGVVYVADFPTGLYTLKAEW